MAGAGHAAGLRRRRHAGGRGRTTIRSTAGSVDDRLAGEAGPTGGGPLLTGGAGNDILDGGSGNDTLIGGGPDAEFRGNDIFGAARANDLLFGGTQNDIYLFRRP